MGLSLPFVQPFIQYFKGLVAPPYGGLLQVFQEERRNKAEIRGQGVAGLPDLP